MLGQTVAGLLRGRPITIGADATVTDGVLAMVAANVGALALTTRWGVRRARARRRHVARPGAGVW